MKARKKLNKKRERRAYRVGTVIVGTSERPRLAVIRSNRYVYAQLIDDSHGKTLAAVSTLKMSKTGTKATGKSAESFAAGEMIGKKAVELGIKSAVFDRRSARFHGRIKSFADGAKNGGLKI